MTPLQLYVKEHGYQRISDELGIATYEHPTLPLVGFKYSQIDSQKTHPVVRHSRGTVLEKETWKVVAHPFVRFFNYGENQDELKTFDWSDFTVTTKEDGSLVLCYHYDDEWHVNTSGSFGLGQYSKFKNATWRDLFWETASKCGVEKRLLNPHYTYIFELCTLDNKVVRMYPESKIFLLSTFVGATELPWERTAREAREIGAATPEVHKFGSIDEVEKFLAEKEQSDLSFEGVVIRDKNNVRFKVKSKSYLALHHLNDNGNIGRYDRLVQLALSNDGDEVLTYMPELKDRFNEVKDRLETAYQNLLNCWRENHHTLDQKTFALAVKQHQFSAILFQMKKSEDKSERALKHLWSQSAELVTKRLYGEIK